MRVLEQTATVRYQVADYEGEIDVMCDENDDYDFIATKARDIVLRKSGGSFPMGYERWEVVDRY